MSDIESTTEDAQVADTAEAAVPISSDRWVRTREAAAIIGFSRGTLANWRVLEKGPPFTRAGGDGACRYRVADLHAWMRKGASEAVSGLGR